MLDILLNPNVGYFLLVSGLVLAVLALFAPGTGVLEVGALFALLLSGYTLANLPVNIWAVIVLLLGVFPFALALRRTQGRWSLIFLLIALAALIVGSIFVFRTPEGRPAVNPILAVVGSGGSAALLWLMARKSLEASVRSRSHDPDRLVGQVGIARTDIRGEGTVYIGAEEWSATSSTYIKAGEGVRVLRRKGLILEVERDRMEA